MMKEKALTVWPFAAKLATSSIDMTSPATTLPRNLLGRIMLSNICFGEYGDTGGDEVRFRASPPADSRSPGIVTSSCSDHANSPE